MTTFDNPITEKMNGSSRMMTVTDSPWWIVRPSLAAGLLSSFTLAVCAFRFAEIHRPAPAFTARSGADVMQVLSSTPALAGFALFACILIFSRKSSRSLRALCVLLALASLSGAAINTTRDSHGRGPIEVWVENALAAAPAMFAQK